MTGRKMSNARLCAGVPIVLLTRLSKTVRRIRGEKIMNEKPTSALLITFVFRKAEWLITSKIHSGKFVILPTLIGTEAVFTQLV